MDYSANLTELEERLNQLPSWKTVEEVSLGVRMLQELGNQLGPNPSISRALELTAGDDIHDVLTYLMGNASKLDLMLFNQGHVETRLTPPRIVEVSQLPAMVYVGFNGEFFDLPPNVGYARSSFPEKSKERTVLAEQSNTGNSTRQLMSQVKRAVTYGIILW